MTSEAAKMLIEALAIEINITAELRNKIKALEKALSVHQRPLYLSYQTSLDNENRDSSPLLSQESLAVLQATLVQRD
jgi:hypothetical protein